VSWIHFSNIGMIHLLWVVPGMALFFWWASRRRREAVSRVTGLKGLVSLKRSRRSLRAAVYLASLLFLTVAVLRPGWNPEPMTVRQEGRDVVFAVDVSRSMLARDLAPNRLERAKLAILDVLPVLDGDRVAVVAFAGSSSVVCPLTRDYGFFRWAVEGLSPGSTEEGGTLMGDAIRRITEDVFDPLENRYKDLILITDGEDQESFPAEAAAVAGRQGVRIITIGLGDDMRGSPIPVETDSGETRYLEDNGVRVITRLVPDTLRQVATATPGGRYLHAATGVFDLGEIYRDLIQSEQSRDLSEVEITIYQEKFQLFVLAAFLLLVFELLIGEVPGSFRWAWAGRVLMGVRAPARALKRAAVRVVPGRGRVRGTPQPEKNSGELLSGENSERS
jgi:Ca-activated chloride channel family protein